MSCSGCGAGEPEWAELKNGAEVDSGPMAVDRGVGIPGHSVYNEYTGNRLSKSTESSGDYVNWSLRDVQLVTNSGRCSGDTTGSDATESESSEETCEQVFPCGVSLTFHIEVTTFEAGNTEGSPEGFSGAVDLEVTVDGIVEDVSTEDATTPDPTVVKKYDPVDGRTAVTTKYSVPLDADAGCGTSIQITIDRSDLKLRQDTGLGLGSQEDENSASAAVRADSIGYSFRLRMTCDACEKSDYTTDNVDSQSNTLWDRVVASYNSDDLVSLTNIRNRAATTIDNVVGAVACQGVVDLWPIYAQQAFDLNNATHVEVAKRAVIALLWTRGGSATNVAKVEWDEVFGNDGMLGKLKKTTARARSGPSSSSGLVSSREDDGGRKMRGWSDPDTLPTNLLPRMRPADD